MYSLWRNGVQLGHLIHVQEMPAGSTPTGLAGVLVPSTSVSDLRAVRQTRFVALPGCPVVQEFQDDEARTGFDPSVCVVPLPAFMQLGPDGSGVPSEAVFTVRTDAGAEVPSYILEIDRQDLPPEVDASALREAGLPEDLRSVCVIRLEYEEEQLSPEWIEAIRHLRADLGR